MRILIDAAVAEDLAALPWLHRILQRVEDGWHFWDVENGEDLFETAWLRDPGHTGAYVAELLRRSIVRSAYPISLHRRRIRVTVEQDSHDPKELLLPPEVAARFLDQPLVILLENRESDGAFLDAVVETLGEAELRSHWRLDPSPIRKDSRGGFGDMERHVRHEVARTSPPTRLLILRDGGGVGAGQISRDAERLQRLCRRHGVPCWILRKNEAENYLPGSLLARVVQDGARFEAWQRLSTEQKDFYDLKEGLGSGTVPALFVQLSQEDKGLLKSGFGSSLDRLWNIRPIDPNDLGQRGGPELNELIELLCELL